MQLRSGVALTLAVNLTRGYPLLSLVATIAIGATLYALGARRPSAEGMLHETISSGAATPNRSSRSTASSRRRTVWQRIAKAPRVGSATLESG
jgi:hypothetical protein